MASPSLGSERARRWTVLGGTALYTVVVWPFVGNLAVSLVVARGLPSQGAAATAIVVLVCVLTMLVPLALLLGWVVDVRHMSKRLVFALVLAGFVVPETVVAVPNLLTSATPELAGIASSLVDGTTALAAGLVGVVGAATIALARGSERREMRA